MLNDRVILIVLNIRAREKHTGRDDKPHPGAPSPEACTGQGRSGAGTCGSHTCMAGSRSVT